MRTGNFYILFLFLTFSSATKLYAQEKKYFLQHRYDGFTETINKHYNKQKLTTLKNDFAQIGIDFNFSKLAFNKKNEIIRITLSIKNKKSSASLTLYENKKAIPFVKIGEVNSIVFIKLIKKTQKLITPN